MSERTDVRSTNGSESSSGRSIKYWHGLGACLQPHTVRRIETAKMRGIPVRPTTSLEHPEEYVYGSTSREVALAFSVLGGGAAVCEIEPDLLAAEADPDFPTLGVRFHGPVRSLSVEVVAHSALPNARQITKTLAADRLWERGNPQYSQDGYLRAPPISRARGYVDADFRWLGQWWPFHFIYPRGDGAEMALDEHGQPHLMYPPGHPHLQGRRRVPIGSLHDAWTQPGRYPSEHDMLWRLQQRVEARDPTLRNVRMPWEW